MCAFLLFLLSSNSWAPYGPSFLPASVHHHRKPILRAKKEEKSSKIFDETSNFFPQTFVFHIDNITKIKQMQKIHRRAKSKHRNIPANFVNFLVFKSYSCCFVCIIDMFSLAVLFMINSTIFRKLLLSWPWQATSATPCLFKMQTSVNKKRFLQNVWYFLTKTWKEHYMTFI